MSKSNTQLVRRSLLGDSRAFGELVRAHQAAIMSLVMGKIPRLDDAKDITQEVFIRAYMQLHVLQDPNKFSSWIRRIASNLCLDKLRQMSRIDTSEAIAGEMQEGGISPGPEEKYAYEELRAYVDMLVDIKERVAEQVSAGKSLDEIIGSKPTEKFDGDWGDGFLKPDQFVKIVYMDLSGKK